MRGISELGVISEAIIDPFWRSAQRGHSLPVIIPALSTISADSAVFADIYFPFEVSGLRSRHLVAATKARSPAFVVYPEMLSRRVGFSSAPARRRHGRQGPHASCSHRSHSSPWLSFPSEPPHRGGAARNLLVVPSARQAATRTARILAVIVGFSSLRPLSERSLPAAGRRRPCRSEA